MGQSCETPSNKCWNMVNEGREAIYSYKQIIFKDLQEVEDGTQEEEELGLREKMHKKLQALPEGVSFSEWRKQQLEEQKQKQIDRRRREEDEKAEEIYKHHGGKRGQGKRAQVMMAEVASLGDRAHVAVSGRLPQTPEPAFAIKEMALLGPNAEQLLLEELVEDHQAVLRSMKGSSPLIIRPNQDDLFYLQTTDMYRIMAVIDGHGEEGHVVAAMVRGHMMRYLVAHAPWTRSPDPTEYKHQMTVLLKEAFKAAHDAVVHQKEVDVRLSGATATVIIHDVRAGWLHVGWVGNCKCVIADLQEEDFVEGQKRRGPKKQSLMAVPLTNVEHTTKQEHEKERLLKAGAEILTGKSDGEIVISGERYPGIPVTRVLGNKVAQAIGVIHEPHVNHREVICSHQGKDAKFAVIATDGVWDVLRNSEVIMSIHEAKKVNLDSALEHVVTKAQENWEKKGAKQGGVIDDISAGLLWLKDVR